ncbi:hypothetical protein M3P21_08850 [Ruegeria sp. 2012CJ41-6]|uniref:Uncharacterized protein n=1 Tax=Ruegeria spongiae TaxID=2942209 RepID=A0ABT0Q2I3_9RHOB|nr:hypothetical protein [Ruegeria spongiae]MCL6283637.1 hypothetical protein [Ruegeria spongiae]
MSGVTATVMRTLTLPKSGKLAEKALKDTYKIEIELAGQGPKTAVGQAILKAFPKVLDNDLNSRRKQWDDRNIKIWKDTGTALEHKNMTEQKAQALVKAAEKQITANWNEYNQKIAKPTALSIVEALAKNEAKKAGEKIGKSKIKFWSEDLKESRLGIWGSLIGAAVFGAATTPLGWIGAGLSAVLLLGKGYRSAWKIAQKQSVDVQTNLNNIKDGLSTAQSALNKLEPHLKMLGGAQSKTAAQMVTAQLELEKMRQELEKLETRAKTEKAVKEGEYIKKLRAGVDNQFFKVEALHKTIVAQASLEKRIADAIGAVEAAASEATARRSGWNKIMADYTDVSKESDSLISAMSKLAGKLG